MNPDQPTPATSRANATITIRPDAERQEGWFPTPSRFRQVQPVLDVRARMPITSRYTPSRFGGWVRDPLRRVSAFPGGPGHHLEGFEKEPRASAMTVGN